MRSCILILLCGSALAQSTPPSAAAPKLFGYFVLPGETAYTWGSIIVDAPLKLYRETFKGPAHIGADFPPPQPVTPGFGLISVELPGQPTAIAVNSGSIAYRAEVPTAPGTDCAPQGSAAWAGDAQGFWYCIRTQGGFVWQRISVAPPTPLALTVTPVLAPTGEGALRSNPPLAPGPCPGDAFGWWAADASFQYFCVPGTGNSFVLARTAVTTKW